MRVIGVVAFFQGVPYHDRASWLYGDRLRLDDAERMVFMGAVLDALHHLQEIELQIAEVRQAIARKQNAVRRQETRIADLDGQIRDRELARRQAKMESDSLSLDVKSHDDSIAKLRAGLNQAKTNKEYSALLTQLNTEKADNSKVEEKWLATQNDLEAKAAEIKALQEERTKEETRLGELQAAVREVEQKNKGRLDKLTAERGHAAGGIPPKTLDCFNRVAQRNDGEAMALIIRTHPKRDEYACEGCNMSVTLEQVHNLLSRDEAVLCNTCGRILYMETQVAGRGKN